MKKSSVIVSFAAFFALGMAFFSNQASAYIDPSAMTYIVQLVVGIVIAGGTAFAFFFKRIKRKFRKDDSEIENYDKQEDVVFDNDDEFDIDKIDDNLK